MDNKDVRRHLRKGEQAVALLKELGYTYKEGDCKPVWVAPAETPMDALLAPIATALTELAKLKKAAEPTPVKAGDYFMVKLPLPETFTGLRSCWPDFAKRVFKATTVCPHTRNASITVAHFGRDSVSTHGLWLPIEQIIKVSRPDADF